DDATQAHHAEVRVDADALSGGAWVAREGPRDGGGEVCVGHQLVVQLHQAIEAPQHLVGSAPLAVAGDMPAQPDDAVARVDRDPGKIEAHELAVAQAVVHVLAEFVVSTQARQAPRGDAARTRYGSARRDVLV